MNKDLTARGLGGAGALLGVIGVGLSSGAYIMAGDNKKKIDQNSALIQALQKPGSLSRVGTAYHADSYNTITSYGFIRFSVEKQKQFPIGDINGTIVFTHLRFHAIFKYKTADNDGVHTSILDFTIEKHGDGHSFLRMNSLSQSEAILSMLTFGSESYSKKHWLTFELKKECTSLEIDIKTTSPENISTLVVDQFEVVAGVQLIPESKWEYDRWILTNSVDHVNERTRTDSNKTKIIEHNDRIDILESKQDKSYSGFVGGDGSLLRAPNNWTGVHISPGYYQVNHNVGSILTILLTTEFTDDTRTPSARVFDNTNTSFQIKIDDGFDCGVNFLAF